MVYLLAQIFLCLLGAFLLGGVVVWLFMRNVRDRGVQEGQAQATASTSKLETELTAAREGMARYRDRSQALEKDLASLRDRLERVRKESEMRHGKQSGDHEGARVASREGETVRLRQETHKAEEAAKNAAARAGELEALVNSQKGKLVSLQEEVAGMASLRRELETVKASLRQRDERISVVETDMGSARAIAATDDSRPTKIAKHKSDVRAHDDLKRIKGIGAVLERLLHQHDVHTFQQIATWTKKDIDRIDAKMERFKGRIRRDDWVSQAKKLCKE